MPPLVLGRAALAGGWMLCGKMLEFARFDRLVLVQRRVRDPEFDACRFCSPGRYNWVGVPCLVS